MRFVVDMVTLFNRREVLAYEIGKPDGIYVEQHGELVDVGVYQDALPHVGDALFQPIIRRAFAHSYDARAWAHTLVDVANDDAVEKEMRGDGH
jgi:hypothetical protein